MVFGNGMYCPNLRIRRSPADPRAAPSRCTSPAAPPARAAGCRRSRCRPCRSSARTRIDRAVRRIVLEGRRDHGRVDRRNAGRVEVRPVVEAIARRLQSGVRHARECSGSPALSCGSGDTSVSSSKRRHLGVRRLLARRRPLVEIFEQRALHRRRIERIQELLAVAPCRRVAGAAVLLARQEVEPRQRMILEVLLARPDPCGTATRPSPSTRSTNRTPSPAGTCSSPRTSCSGRRSCPEIGSNVVWLANGNSPRGTGGPADCARCGPSATSGSSC